MSLYNMLFGLNPNTEIILAILGLKTSDVERFRDCGFEESGIFIYTRTGGGNREDYPNEKLTSNPYYLNDEDDDFDETYATYHFKLPDEIKDDCVKFQNIRENGISGKLIQWVIKTLKRPESERDKYSRLWDEQNKLVQQSKQTNIIESNGHTITPLDDRSTEKYLKLMEDADGKELSYCVRPYKILIRENVRMWEGLDKDKPETDIEMCRLKVTYPEKWEIDDALWERWKNKFGKKFPKAIETIKSSIER